MTPVKYECDSNKRFGRCLCNMIIIPNREIDWVLVTSAPVLLMCSLQYFGIRFRPSWPWSNDISPLGDGFEWVPTQGKRAKLLQQLPDKMHWKDLSYFNYFIFRRQYFVINCFFIYIYYFFKKKMSSCMNMLWGYFTESKFTFIYIIFQLRKKKINLKIPPEMNLWKPQYRTSRTCSISLCENCISIEDVLE